MTFTAAPQTTGAVDKVIFEFVGVNGQTIQQLEDTTAPYTVTFDVGRLPASKGDTHPYVIVTPVVAGKGQCPSLYDIEVMGNPMASPYLQPLPASRTAWNGAAGTYEFEGILPYVEDLLPAKYSLGTVPFLGEIKNEFNTGVFVKGYFDLEGNARIYLAEAFADAMLLSLPSCHRATYVKISRRLGSAWSTSTSATRRTWPSPMARWSSIATISSRYPSRGSWSSPTSGLSTPMSLAISSSGSGSIWKASCGRWRRPSTRP